jgi:hypothetical protein
MCKMFIVANATGPFTLNAIAHFEIIWNMKKTLILGILILSNTVFGQIPGKTIIGPIVLLDTLTVKQGDIIHLGKGSDPETGNFIHLYAPKNKVTPIAAEIILEEFTKKDIEFNSIPRMDLDKGFAGKQLAVESFSKVSSKKEGEKILGVINMKEYQFIEGIFFNDVVVDFEPALRSGEIIKISASELTSKATKVELLFTPFEMTRKGIVPVVVALHNLSKNDLYNKSLNWTNSFYQTQNQATITSVLDENININDVAKNVKFGTIMGLDLIGDLPYLFTVDFTDGEITMTFTLGGKNGDITDENGGVIASTSPAHMFNKKGEVFKMSKTLKIEAEKVMNDLSYALVDYLMK